VSHKSPYLRRSDVHDARSAINQRRPRLARPALVLLQAGSDCHRVPRL